VLEYCQTTEEGIADFTCLLLGIPGFGTMQSSLPLVREDHSRERYIPLDSCHCLSRVMKADMSSSNMKGKAEAIRQSTNSARALKAKLVRQFL
jgi:hypothetical protein